MTRHDDFTLPIERIASRKTADWTGLPPGVDMKDAAREVLDRIEGLGYKIIGNEKTRDGMFTLAKKPGKPSGFFVTLFDGNSRTGISYKEMHEDMSPYAVGPSLRLLMKADPPVSEYAKEWREKALAHAGMRTQKFNPGDIVTVYGDEYVVEGPAQQRGQYLVRHRQTGMVYRTKPVTMQRVASQGTSKTAGEHPLGRGAIVYFGIATEDYNIEEDADNGDEFAQSLMNDGGRGMNKLEGDALRNLSRMFGTRITDEGHDGSGELICKFPVDSWEDIKKIDAVLSRHHVGGDDEIDTGVQYVVARDFRLYPDGISGRVFYGEAPGAEGTWDDWLSEHKDMGRRASQGQGKTALGQATVEAFLAVASSKLTQYDAKLQAKQPNMYRLGHFLEALNKVRADVRSFLKRDDPDALDALRKALLTRFTSSGGKSDLPPINAVLRQISDYQDSGKMPSLTRRASDKTAKHPLDRVRGHQLLPSGVARKIPAIYSQENEDDPIAWVKLFSPYTNATWYITEYDPSSGEAFGWADLGMGGGELGYISIRELEGLQKRGLPLVERDLYWKPRKLSQAKRS